MELVAAWTFEKFHNGPLNLLLEFFSILSTPILGSYSNLAHHYWSQGFLVLDFNFFLAIFLLGRRLKNKIAIAPKTKPPM